MGFVGNDVDVMLATIGKDIFVEVAACAGRVVVVFGKGPMAGFAVRNGEVGGGVGIVGVGV